MYNARLTKEENAIIAQQASDALEHLRVHGKLPPGLRAWHLFMLKELMEKEEDFPYMLDMTIGGGKKHGP